jgi:quercetin dioxygenase-like cupin family protein
MPRQPKEDSMKVIRSADRKSKVSPAANFTGTVFSDEVVVGSTPSRMRASVVTFTPGARTAWHSHPVGQTLFCLSGAGRVQREGEQVQEIRAGDTVIIPPNTRHWHGSAPGKLFSHLAMSETSDKGEGTAWFEHVSEEDYNAAPAPVT